MLCVKGEKRAVIERREVHPGLTSEPDMVNTLSLTISDSAGLATRVEKVGYHSSFNDGQVDIAVQPLNRTVGVSPLVGSVLLSGTLSLVRYI